MANEQLLTVFIIDDDDDIRSSLSRALGKRGYTVETFASARHFLNEYDHNKLGCVILDYGMPEMNGLEFVRAVRGNPTYRTLPLMMVTTETESSQMGKALAAGANEYVMKPFTKDVIQEKLKIIGIK